MNTPQLPRFLSRAPRPLTRRGALPLIGAAIIGIVAAPDPSQARKGKRQRRCKKSPAARVPPCAEHCFPDFPLCYTRTVGAPLCANGAIEDGETPCATDQDCLGNPAKPYCLVSATARETGSTSRFTTCEPYAAGCCISVLT